MPQLASLAAPLLGVLLGWTGAAKLRTRPATAADTALARLLGGPHRTARALRTLGAAEVLLAAALLASATAPVAPFAGWATAALGAGFLAYLGYARRSAPDASCGCSGAVRAPAGVLSFARAGAVLAGGVALATVATGSWWTVLTDRPAASAAALAAGAALLAGLSATPERRWTVAARRLRIRLFGHPLTGRGSGGGGVPVSASVELVERSLAWETVAPMIRSGLVEHWDEDGWRILHYTGTHHVPAAAAATGTAAAGRRDTPAAAEIRDAAGAPDAPGASEVPAAPHTPDTPATPDTSDTSEPVTILFAVDAAAHWDLPGEPIVRVTVLHRDTGEPLPVEPPPQRRPLPLAG